MLSTIPSTALELNTSYYTTIVGSSTLDGFSVSVLEPENTTSTPYMLPAYIRTTSMVICIAVMILGIVGNLMVPLVVLRGKDMRNSTNIFLVNLSAADLCVLVICAPTVLVEVNAGPQVWPLGEHMCKAVPFVELTVAHASVLTILAISFERYYAICEPLRAGYVCTKARATFLCFLAWLAAAICTSPMIWVAEYSVKEVTMRSDSGDGNIESRNIPVCLMLANTTATSAFFLLLVVVFFFVPLLLLLILYSIIVRHLIRDDSSTGENYHARARKQVVLMLLTVVLSFFICLAPFNALTFYFVLAPQDSIDAIDNDTLLNIIHSSRIMFYLNSAVNPILYNLMSSKFRLGFLKLCGLRKRRNSDRSNIQSTLDATRLSRSPILSMVDFTIERDVDGFEFAVCQTQANTPWMVGFILTTIIGFFIVPLLILVVLYTVIARHLMANPAISRGPANNLLKYRKQVVLMLGTVVLCFFICLLPFRAFTLWVLVTPPETIVKLGVEGYFCLLYMCRVMLYLNSAINPILYNLMSTKFREGFLRLCGLRPNKRKQDQQTNSRTRTNTTGSTNCSSNNSDFWSRRHSSNKSCGVKVPNNVIPSEKALRLPLFSAVTETIIKNNSHERKQESYV